MSNCTAEEIEEFKVEATELLDEAEGHLLSIDKGGDFLSSYDAVFRVFHSLKGASGFLGLESLQAHMHQLEGQYQQLKAKGSMSKGLVGYFLRGVDVARKVLAGEEASFDHMEFASLSESPTSIPQAMPEGRTDGEAAVPEEALAEESNVVIDGSSSSPRNLAFVVGPETEALLLLRQVLEEESFEVIHYTDSVIALADVEVQRPSLLLLSPEKSTFTPAECLSYLKENKVYTELVLTISGKEIDACPEENIFGFVDLSGHPKVIKASVKMILRLRRLSQVLDKTLDTLYRQLPDLALVMEEAGKEALLKEVDGDFRSLIVERRSLKVS